MPLPPSDSDLQRSLVEFYLQSGLTHETIQQMAKQGILKIPPHLLQQPKKPYDPLDEFITEDPDLQEMKRRVVKLRNKSIPVLIIGETGTGKELIAQALHVGSNRMGLFIAVNCGAITETLVEAALFGASKGSYTGCHSDRIGYFEQAANGTLFLDEISEMPLSLQVKLLRVLESKKIMRVGDSLEKPISCRIVCATNVLNLEEKKEFRTDLYYRIAGSILRTKPLRERREDIRAIAYWMDSPKHEIPEEVIDAWKNDELKYKFKGNVRQLKNMIEEWRALR